MRRLLIGFLAAVFASGYALTLGSAATGTGTTPDPKDIAKQILASPAGHFLSGNGRMTLEMMARGDRQLAPSGESQAAASKAAAATKPAQGGEGPGSPALANVRVNNPAEDTHQVEQTTQSETSIAAVGNNVAVGFNDSQTTLLLLTAGSNFNGYAYSRDGGATFTDGGVVPNAPACANGGDPWLASDRQGAMYYSSLVFCLTPPGVPSGDIGVAKSTDGGRTWTEPIILTTSLHSFFYMADKDAMTSGRDPNNASKDVVYDAWDDFTFDPTLGTTINGVPVAHSNDGGSTWSIAYAAKGALFAPCSDPAFFSSTSYIGAQPIVDPSNGALYVTVEKSSQDCPPPGSPPGKGGPVRSIVVFKSIDGGNSFGPEKTVAVITPAAPPFDGFNLGDGKFMRNLELPTAAFAGGNLFIAWNDGGAPPPGNGHSHIRLAKSTDGGMTWTNRFVTGGANDQMQPAMSGDRAGLHILYYQRNPDNTLDVMVGNSDEGNSFSRKRVSTQSFPGVFTLPGFDPVTVPTYMGDYIANISSGDSQLFAWGDNRDKIRDFLYPSGRNDPDVFLARQSGQGGQQG